MSRQRSETQGIPAPDTDDVLDDLLSVAERVVARARGKGADAAEAFVQTDSGRSFSIEKNSVGFTQVGGEAGIGLRVQKDGRLGFAYYSDLARQDAAIEQALAVAAKAEPSRFVFPVPQAYPVVGGTWDHPLAEYDTDAGLEAVREIIAGARAVHAGVTVSGGSIGVGAVAAGLVNSEGVEFAARSTGFGASAYVVLKDGDNVATGFEGHETTRLDALADDPRLVGQKAARQALDTLHPSDWGDPRDTTVVFTPDAAAALIEFITVPALHGDKAARGESLFSGKLGEPMVDERILLVDDPTRDAGLGSAPADDEGLPSRKVPLLRDGAPRAFLYDLGAAYEYGGGDAAATASAVRSGGLSDDRTYQEAPTTHARNVVLTARDARPLEALIADIDDGILVHDLLGAHTANPTSGDFSVSSTVLFRIRQGALAGAVSGVMLAGNLPRLLRDGFVGCSAESERTSGHFSPIGLEMPHLALSGVHVVGG